MYHIDTKILISQQGPIHIQSTNWEYKHTTHKKNLQYVFSGCSSGGRAVAHQLEGRWFDSGFPRLYVEAPLGKTLNPTLPTDV